MAQQSTMTAALFLQYLKYFLALLVILIYSQSGSAHPLDVVYFQLEQIGDSQFKSCLNIHPEPLKTVTKFSIFTQENLKAASLFTLAAHAKNCTNTMTDATIEADDIKLCYLTTCVESTKFILSFEFLDSLDPLFSVIGQYKDVTGQTAFTVNKTKNKFDLEIKKMNFFELGIEHIGATIKSWTNELGKFQIADGIDHVLFILLLVLISATWQSLLLRVTGFTVGHSLTLGLSLGGIFIVPAAFIEPIIAATIAYMAAQVLRKGSSSSHLGATVLFGLIHGMGFSYILTGLTFSTSWEFLKILLLFNAGIEVGQIIVILFCLPLFFMNRFKMLGRVYVQRFLGLSICALSLYWCFQRFSVLF